MEGLLIGVILLVGGPLVRLLREHARWEPHVGLRGSQPLLVGGLPEGMDAARRCPIADIRPGDYVALHGVVAGLANLVAPLSRRLCMASDATAYDRINGNLVGRVLQASWFVLEDGSGRVTVDARGAFVRAPYDHKLEGVDRYQLPEPLRTQVPELLWLDAHEGCILPGAQVLVIGVVHAAPDAPDAAYRRGNDPDLRVAGGADRAALVSTLPGDLAGFEPRL